MFPNHKEFQPKGIQKDTTRKLDLNMSEFKEMPPKEPRKGPLL